MRNEIMECDIDLYGISTEIWCMDHRFSARNNERNKESKKNNAYDYLEFSRIEDLGSIF